MRSQNSISTKPSSLNLTLLNNNNKKKDHNRSTTPSTTSIHPVTSTNIKIVQMTTGSGINTKNNNNNNSSSQETASCKAISPLTSTTSLNNNSNSLNYKSSTSTTTRNLSTNNNSTTVLNNSNNKLNATNENNNPNSTKLQTLEQRKLELEKLLSEKNWLLQQIHKQEAQILNGNYENFNLFELGKLNGTAKTVISAGNASSSSSQINTINSILRRKGSSSLKLPKSNVHVGGKNNRFTLSKSEYDLAVIQDNKQAMLNVMSIKKRQGTPQKTNSFHDSTSASALNLIKSPATPFEYNSSGSIGIENAEANGLGGGNIKYSIVHASHHQNGSSSNENLTKNMSITQCDKYYLSPTSQMYTDGNGFIKASQNIKQRLSSSPSPMHKFMSIQIDSTNSHHSSLMLNNGGGSQSHLSTSEQQYDNVDALSVTPSSNTVNIGEQQLNQIQAQHSNFWQAISNSDQSGVTWCDNSYNELDSESVNQYHSLATKSFAPGSSLSQNSAEGSTLGNSYLVGQEDRNGGGPSLGTTYPSKTIEKACDELSLSSVNSETTKKPKNKQWMESSLDGPIIRSNALQTTTATLITDSLNIYPALSPALSSLSPLSQNTLQYAYYNVARQSSAAQAVVPGTTTNLSGILASSPPSLNTARGAGGGLLLVPGTAVNQPRPPTRTLTHHSHSQQLLQQHSKQNFHRERTKLSSQSMSSSSYRTPKTKLDEENSNLSHSTSYLNYEPYHHHHHFQPKQQQQTQVPSQYLHNHFNLDMPSGQQQHPKLKSPIAPPISTAQQSMFGSIIQPTSTIATISATAASSPSKIVMNDDEFGSISFDTSSVVTKPSRFCNNHTSIQVTQISNKKLNLPNSLSINTISQTPLQLPLPTQISPGSETGAVAATSPDIRIESPKNVTVVQQATFLPYKEVTKPFEMSDFYKYSTKFRQKDPNAATISSRTLT